MRDASATPPASRVALILAGGAARGAYEVGVLRYVIEDLPRILGHRVALHVLCGTSVGAINVCALAAFADQPQVALDRLRRSWNELRVDQMVRLNTGEVLAMFRDLWRGSRARGRRRGGLLHPAGLERVLGSTISFPRIDQQIAARHLDALTVSATHVTSGRTVVFVQREAPGLPPWNRDPTIVPKAARIRMQHALASAAIPIMFPAVEIDGELYCDGGLRQNVPLSPARRLGADRLLVVNPHFLAESNPEPALGHGREQGFPDPLFLLGKTLNALLLDRIDNDISRLEGVNAILEAGRRRYGPDFVEQLNQELKREPERGIRPLQTVLVRSSQDIGRLSAEFVRSPRFDRRTAGMALRVLRRLSEDAQGEGDLLSYLLFDGEFAGELMELGYADARRREQELCALFTPVG